MWILVISVVIVILLVAFYVLTVILDDEMGSESDEDHIGPFPPAFGGSAA